MASSLKIVATPIGNIKDISTRAIHELKNADVILAEDTRLLRQLINILGISLKEKAQLFSCHAEREKDRGDLVIKNLHENKNVILVSDAGCPVISDPGSLLLNDVVKKGGGIEIIPGPSALTAAIMGAALDTSRFCFLGFLPKRKSHREKMIINSYKAQLALVIFESPLRVQALLDELFHLLGPKRVVVARELTKIFETFHRGILGEPLMPPLVSKGECVVIVERSTEDINDDFDSEELKEFVASAKSQGKTNRDITGMVVDKFKIKKKEAFLMVLEIVKDS